MHNIRIWLTAAVVLFSLTVSAQQTLSPYSRYGLGEQTYANSVRNLGMGGISAGVYDGSTINRGNPASYADIRLTTLDISGYTGLRMQKSTIASNTSFSGGNSNVSFAFSNNKGYAVVFGVSPISSIGYNILTLDSVLVDSVWERYSMNYTGSGGLNQFYIGTGIRFFRSFRAGINLNYTFGNSRYSWHSDFEDTLYYSANVHKTVSLEGFNPEIGLQWGDTVRYVRMVDRVRDLEQKIKEADNEIASWQKEEKSIRSRQEKQKVKINRIALRKKALNDEEAGLRARIEGLMQNETENEKEIGKLQDRSFRLERKANGYEKTMRTMERELNAELSRAEQNRRRQEDRKVQLGQRIEDVKAGKLSADVEKKQSFLVRVGGTWQPGMNLNGSRVTTFNNSFVSDTIGSASSGSISMPMTVSGGFTLNQPNKWAIGADVRFVDWSQYSFFGEPNTLNNSLRVSVGGEWVPGYLDAEYGKRIAWRAGAYYHGSNLTLATQQIKEVGITLGMGLPLGRFINMTQTWSRLNFGLSIGRTGTTEGGLLQETTIRMNVGLNLNDVWFRRWRID